MQPIGWYKEWGPPQLEGLYGAATIWLMRTLQWDTELPIVQNWQFHIDCMVSFESVFYRSARMIEQLEKSRDSSITTPSDTPNIATRVQRRGSQSKIDLAIQLIKEEGPIKGEVLARKLDILYGTFMSNYQPVLRQLNVKNDGSGYFLE